MSMRLGLTLVAMSAVLGMAADTSRERLAAGVRAQQSGDLAAASAAYRDVLQTNPSLTVARHLLGVCELQSGNMPEGIRQLEMVRRQDPSNLQATYTLVSTYIAAGMLEEAGKIVNSTLRRDLSAAGRLMRGSYAMAQGEYDVAIQQLERARSLDGHLPGVASQLGVAYCFANNLEKAVPILESALRENPSDINAAAFLGWLYKDRDRKSEAAALLQRTVQERPGDGGALFLLAQLTQSRGDTAEAVRMLEKVVDTDPRQRAAHVLLARLYQQLGRTEEAAGERSIIQRLNAELQALQPQPQR